MMALGKPEPGNRTLWGDTGVASVEKRWWYSVDGGAWREDTADMAFGFSVGAPVSSEANTWVPERQKGYQLGGRTYSVDDQGAVAEGVETGALWVFDKAGDAWSKEDTPFGVVGSAGTGLPWVGVGDDQLIVRFGGVVNRTWVSSLFPLHDGRAINGLRNRRPCSRLTYIAPSCQSGTSNPFPQTPHTHPRAPSSAPLP